MSRKYIWLAWLTFAFAGAQGASAQGSASLNVHRVPLFMSESNEVQEGFVRVINHSAEAGAVSVFAIDDAGGQFGPVTLSLGAGANQHFNSTDLEFGNAGKGLDTGTGAGQGDWRLRFETELDIEVLAYIRTEDGFVTSMHDLVEDEGHCWRVPFFNPASNFRQRSLLRLINDGAAAAAVQLHGKDDASVSPGSTVSLTLAAGTARTLTAVDLESGGDNLTGSLGDGKGKWQIAVTADRAIDVVNILESPTGNLTNLSRANTNAEGRCWPADPLAGADGSIVEHLRPYVENGQTPGVIAAVFDASGVRAIAAAGVRKQGSPEVITARDLVHIGSNTKAMTGTMLATLVADGTFANGWETTVRDVFPELVGEIHADYESVTLWQLVSMAGGLAANPSNWLQYSELPLMERRYTLVRENLATAPAGAVGEFLYSNLSYLVAGTMAEQLIGKSWEALMRERLFKPLGMSTAGFGAPGTPDEVDQPWGHRRNDGSGEWAARQFDNPEALGPAGTAHLTFADWAKFVRLWTSDAAPAILDRTQLTQLITPTPGDYAAGWFVSSRPWAEGLTLNHAGSNTYWQTDLWVAPNTNRAYAVAVNGVEDDPDATAGIADEIISKLIEHDP